MFLLWTCSNRSMSGVTLCSSPQRLLWFFLLSTLLRKTTVSTSTIVSPEPFLLCKIQSSAHPAQYCLHSSAATGLQRHRAAKGLLAPLVSNALMHTLLVLWHGGTCMAVQSQTFSTPRNWGTEFVLPLLMWWNSRGPMAQQGCQDPLYKDALLFNLLNVTAKLYSTYCAHRDTEMAFYLFVN